MRALRQSGTWGVVGVCRRQEVEDGQAVRSALTWNSPQPNSVTSNGCLSTTAHHTKVADALACRVGKCPRITSHMIFERRMKLEHYALDDRR